MKKTEPVSSAGCSKRSRSDKRKKESGAAAGESQLRSFVPTQVNLRHFKHLPLLRLHLLPAPRAAGDEAEDAAWSGTGSGVHGTPVLRLNLTNSKSGITDSEGFFFLVGFCFFYEHRYSSERQAPSVWNRPG